MKPSKQLPVTQDLLIKHFEQGSGGGGRQLENLTSESLPDLGERADDLRASGLRCLPASA